MMMQIFLTIVLFGIFALCCFIFYRKRKGEVSDEIHLQLMTLDYLLETVKRRIVEITRDDEIITATNEAYRVRQANKRRIDTALTQAIDGIPQARDIVIALIIDIIRVEVKTEEDACKVIDFRAMDYLPYQEKWEILNVVLSKEYGTEVLDYIEDQYHLTELRDITMDDGVTRPKREFTGAMLDEIFQNEVLSNHAVMSSFGYEDYLRVIAIILFSKYKGFGVVDTLRQLKIDGFHFGTSGSVRYEIEGRWDAMYRATNSVWVQINALWIHFSFIDFGSMNEMRRVTRQLTAYGNLGPMTEKNPLKVNDSPDGSRITAIGTPVGECWSCFIRKFNISSPTLKALLDKEYASNWELVVKLLYFMAKAECNVPFTGQQNTGKTTMMKAFIELCDLMNIRVLEMSFELALREIYPWMDIFTAKPTQYITNSEIQSIFKKSDAYLSMVGEVAEDQVVPNMIQFAIIASAFTTFSHHAKDDYALINGLANSWITVQTGMDKSAAMSSILDVINFNCHLAFVDHNRVVEYISEIVKESELQPYMPLTKSGDVASAVDQQSILQREYYTRVTDRIKFTSRKIIKYDAEKKAYVANDWFTDATTARILDKLNPADRAAFIEFANKEFAEPIAKRKAEKERKRKAREARKQAQNQVMRGIRA